MEECLVSVVLPIYKVEKYLNRCIESVVNQTYVNLEIILIDDGSPDKCPHICDEWARKDIRIKVVHKQNEGLGMARNTGIEFAKGKYVCFFDSDDYIEPHTIEKCIDVAERNDTDIVCFGYSDVSSSGEKVKKHLPHSLKECYKGREVQEYFLPELLMRKSMNLNMSAWSAMYKMELINQIQWKFVSEREIISEDVYSLLYLYKFIDSVAVIEDCLYNYCDNGSSLTHVYREDRYDKIKKFYIECVKLAEILEYENYIRKSLVYPYLANTIAALKQIMVTKVTLSKKMKMLYNVLEDETLQNVLKQLNYKRETKARRFLFYAMRNKMIRLCFILFSIKSYSDTM